MLPKDRIAAKIHIWEFGRYGAKEQTMPATMTRDEWVEARARELMEHERFMPCSCGMEAHTPECDFTISADLAWFKSKELAAEEALAMYWRTSHDC
jgi:hypothetical protein